MGLLDGAYSQTGSAPTRMSRSAGQTGDRFVPDLPSHRVNWLFSGVVLGAAGWLLTLAAVFAAVGKLIVAGGLLGGFAVCGFAMWRGARRLRSVRDRDH
jgi:hypothetical protein